MLALLVVLPLALRLAPIGHGMPRNYVPDTHAVRAALGMAKDKNLVPEVGRYSTYPNLLPYSLLPVYAAEYALGRANGAWSSSADFGQRVLEEPGVVHLPARVVVALMACLAPLFAFLALRAAGAREGAWIGAWLLGTSLLHVQFSTQERPWAPLVSCVLLAAWMAVRYARGGRALDLALCGAAAGLAFAFHQAGLPALALVGLAWLLGPQAGAADTRGSAPKALFGRARHGLLALAAFALVALLLGHAYLLVHGSTPAAELAGSDGLARARAEDPDAYSWVVGIGGQGIVLSFRPQSFLRLSRALVGYEPALLALALLGFVATWRTRALRAPLAFALGWAAFFMTNQNDHVRYLLPLAALLALPAGVAGEGWWRSRRLRPVLVLVLALPLVQALRLVHVLAQPDTRALGELEFARAASSDRIALDRYAPLVELDRASLERIAAWRSLGAREAHRLALLEAGAPIARGVDALPLEDVFLYDDRQGTLRLGTGAVHALGLEPSAVGEPAQAAEVLAQLGATHVLLVTRRPTLQRRHPLHALIAGKQPIWEVDPSVPGRHPEEAFLPVEMEFPLTQLWQVERPGPWMGLYRLGEPGADAVPVDDEDAPAK